MNNFNFTNFNIHILSILVMNDVIFGIMIFIRVPPFLTQKMFLNLFFLLVLGVCVSAQYTNTNDTNLELTVLLKLHGKYLVLLYFML